MDIFSTLSAGPFELTIDNFNDATHKAYPYFQEISNHKVNYYAICPECRNPIRIINLFGHEFEESHTKKRKTHARHTGKDIKGLAVHNQQKYMHCPLHKANSFACKKLRNDEVYNAKLYSLINKNRNRIIKDIREITGINFSKDYLAKIITTYLNSNNYSYIHTNKFNIPYSILFTSKSLDLYGRYLLLDNLTSNEIENNVNNSTNFKVITTKDYKNNISKKITKTSEEYCHIILKFSNHIVKQNTILLSIFEYKDSIENATPLGKKIIFMKPFIYE